MSEELSCTFCGKGRTACSRLILAERALICAECVLVCVGILINELDDAKKQPNNDALLAELEREKGGGDG